MKTSKLLATLTTAVSLGGGLASLSSCSSTTNLTSVNEASNGKYCKIKFDIDTTEEVTLVGNLTTSARVGKYFSTVKKPTLSDTTFSIDKWTYKYTDAEGEEQTGTATDSWKIPNCSNCTITASIKEIPSEQLKVVLFLNGGTVEEKQIYVQENVTSGTTLETILNEITITPPTSKQLDKWYDEEGSEVTPSTTKITENRAFYPTWADEEKVDFLTCEWSEIGIWCNSLENGEITTDQFCAHFINGTETISSMDDFVGLERNVKVTWPSSSIDHSIRVIGTQHDILSEDISKKATLTFEFKDLLTETSGTDKEINWNKESNNTKYSEATISKDETGTGKECGLIYIKTLLPSDLQSIIKKVNKPTGDLSSAVEEEEGKIHQLEDTDPSQYLFLLSGVEIGLGDDEAYISSGYDELEEGYIYKYYEDHSTDDDRKKKTIGKTTRTGYWLRSPFGYYWDFDKYTAFSIIESGSLSYYGTVDGSLPVAPCFCI